MIYYTVLSLAIVLPLLLALLAFRLPWPEGIVLGILAILLLGRRLPDVGHYLGRRLIERRFRN